MRSTEDEATDDSRAVEAIPGTSQPTRQMELFPQGPGWCPEGRGALPAPPGSCPEAELWSKLLFLWSCPWGGGTAHWEQVKQRSNDILATFFCLSNSPGFLINPHFVTTINSLLQDLGIQWEKPQFNVFGEKKPDSQKCQINWILQNSDFPSACGIDVPDCLEAVFPHNGNFGPFSESWQEGGSRWDLLPADKWEDNRKQPLSVPEDI